MEEQKRFIFLITGVKDTDGFVYHALGEEKEILFYKLLYAQPYQCFQGIKEFQAAVKYKPFESGTAFKRYVSIDLSEWYGHEKEEYLDVFFKYLHDFKNNGFSYQFVFTVADKTRQEARKLFMLALEYLGEGDFYEDLTLVDERELKNYIWEHSCADEQVSEMLANIFVKEKMDYGILHALLSDMTDKMKAGSINREMLCNEQELEKLKIGKLFQEEIKEAINRSSKEEVQVKKICDRGCSK